MGGDVTIDIRPAERHHVPAIVEMLADDELGASRENTSSEGLADYERAFDAIAAHPTSTLYVALLGDQVVGTFQLTLIPGMSQRGMTRADVEAVRVHASLRGKGLGARLMAFARSEAERQGAGMLQLTSNKVRGDAHRFYERLGFARSHEGFKLKL
ncbi:GNAT family acetyltransferase [Agaricicola taiwanensis]|uniref:GNAT family acetyltransferase n=2 Tax=Agaricicola taiwanensis TaxID=591372 RepID=A0A8J2YGD7_9RHOB|nr:GNAT family acetyltransferase [Agaricicola taiwanensis]